jgi:hypothetical protein
VRLLSRDEDARDNPMGALYTVQIKLVKDQGVVGKFSFLTVARTYTAVGKARSRPKYITNFRTGVKNERLLAC